ncbi:alpha/beta hydrolase [Nocardioides mangrovi]|uniref:Alpha/beta hydrolase n=1 Tax=Nocardioides mangrovi TaxID=2874580 RepID=A0ABS7UET9_9ACTN|nr:alpha/beta hydrolase [Nocardioides mangrovi]MBZ5739523.1 alpha/beta hydrolase [Nocardioides mangrovi]
MRVLGAAVLSAALALGVAAPASAKPVDPAADAQDMADAYGRITGEGSQLRNPAYLPALVRASTARYVGQLLTQVASPTRLALTAGALVPGWNVGNPLRADWNGTRGVAKPVAFTNRYGALLRGTVYKPLPGARDPYTGTRLTGPYPGVVITEGSVQGSEGMYAWLAEDLAERGYVVLTYDVQGQGTSETLPHQDSPLHQDMVPFCNPVATPEDGELTGCPGVPSQQLSNFVVGTEDALDFFTSTPSHHYPNDQSGGASSTTPYNPFWRLFDRSPDPTPTAPGRDTRVAIIGHSMGAAAVSKVQGTDDRVETVVALDKLTGPDSDGPLDGSGNKPVVPALAVQSEYGFTVTPAELSGGSSLNPTPSPDGPDPMRERATGYDAWTNAGVDSMLVVPHASTHLEYTDIPLVLPASRYGQDLTSVYVQRWLDRYLKDGPAAPLLDTSFRYLEPVGGDAWSPVTLKRGALLSDRYCSAYSLAGVGSDGDIAGVGC